MAEDKIKFKDDAKQARAYDAFSQVFPRPVGQDNKPLYTKGQWFQIRIGQYIADIVYKSEVQVASGTIVKSGDLFAKE